MASKLSIILVTAPNIKSARSIGKTIVSEKLAACVNIVPKIESIYSWQGKLHNDKEVLMIIKTAASSLKRLENKILQLHPYDTPEFVAIKSSSVNKRYLAWAEANSK